MGVGYGQIVELEPPFYSWNAIVIKQKMAWANCACPHGCRKPVIPSWTQAIERLTQQTEWWYEAGLTQQTLNEEIEAIDKRASECMLNQNWKNNGYIVGYICYVLSVVITVSAVITNVILLPNVYIFLYVLIFSMLSIVFINLAVCEWHKYLWNICLKDIENNIANDLNARYSEYKFVWSVHSRMVQHGSSQRSGKYGSTNAYKRKYVDIICVPGDTVGEYTVVFPNGAVCRSGKDMSSEKVCVISIWTVVKVDEIDGRRCRISEPFQGWVSSHTNKGQLILHKGQLILTEEEQNQMEIHVQ